MAAIRSGWRWLQCVRLCTGGTVGTACEKAVDKFCEFSPQHIQCCAVAKDACQFGHEDDPDKLEQCVVEFVKCGATKPKKIPPPPSDFPENGKFL